MPDLTAEQIRRLSTAELVALGEDSLRNTLRDQAIQAHQKHDLRSPQGLEALLRDPDCVRFPTRLAFEFGEMAPHQFAQPDLDYRCPDEDGRVLYLRPILRDRPEETALAVAYMLPVINYGELIRDEHCCLYGSTLLGLMESEFCERIAALADLVGAEVRYLEQAPARCPSVSLEGPLEVPELAVNPNPQLVPL